MKIFNSQGLDFKVFPTGRKEWILRDQPFVFRRGGPADITPKGYKRWNSSFGFMPRALHQKRLEHS